MLRDLYFVSSLIQNELARLALLGWYSKSSAAVARAYMVRVAEGGW